MSPLRRGWWLFLAIVAASAAADLVSKEAIFARLGMPGVGGRIVLVPRVLVLETNLNEGALFGMGQGMGVVFATVSVAAIAGILLAPITFVHANMGFIGLKAFPAAVVGGFTSLPGAIVGGLIIGIVESFAGFYLPEGFKDIAAYVVVLIMLMVKPHGLFGERLRKKV